MSYNINDSKAAMANRTTKNGLEKQSKKISKPEKSNAIIPKKKQDNEKKDESIKKKTANSKTAIQQKTEASITEMFNFPLGQIEQQHKFNEMQIELPRDNPPFRKYEPVQNLNREGRIDFRVLRKLKFREDEIILKYPNENDPSSIEIKFYDLLKLLPDEYLNDTIIDFYLR